MPLPRGCARLLLPRRRLLDVRNVRVVEVQGERVGHGYGEAGGDHYRRGSPARIGRVLARAAVDAVAPALLLPPAARPLGPPRPRPYVAAEAGGLVQALLPRPHLGTIGGNPNDASVNDPSARNSIPIPHGLATRETSNLNARRTRPNNLGSSR